MRTKFYVCKSSKMCHYNYWGFDGCSHELRHMDNRWLKCPCSEHTAPRDCPFATYTRHRIGVPFCPSCLDEVPPNHASVTRIILDFNYLRHTMELSVDRQTLDRFVRDYMAGLRHVKETSRMAGPNNNFYNDIIALYDRFFHRATSEMCAGWETFDAMHSPGGTSYSDASWTPSECCSTVPEGDIVTAGTSNTIFPVDGTIMVGSELSMAEEGNITAAGGTAVPMFDNALAEVGSNSHGSLKKLYGLDNPCVGFHMGKGKAVEQKF
ncbi:hypothetical protein F4808DRAFT_52949 [Astrocystis sublimbata]|nr:hypothetical protein F4808DRAFT_52949 [Astrocystis sublimbata]